MSIKLSVFSAFVAVLGFCHGSFAIRPREQAPTFRAKAVLHDQFIDVRSMGPDRILLQYFLH